MTDHKLHGHSLPPRSFVLAWQGTTPKIKTSHWAPGYTPGHKESEVEAITQAGVDLLADIARLRERWLKLNLLAAQVGAQMKADAFGQMISITETDDPHETMTMPEGALDAESVIARGNEEAKNWNHDGHADGEWVS